MSLRRQQSASMSSFQGASEAERKLMEEEFRREMTYAPFTDVQTTEKERDKQLVRKMFRSLFDLYQQEASIPEYGRVGVGNGRYGATSGVSAKGFQEFVLQYLPDPTNTVGRFMHKTPVFNKSGGKLTEKALMRRLEDLYRDARPNVVRSHVEDLCMHVVMANEVDTFLETLKGTPIKKRGYDDEDDNTEYAPCTAAALHDTNITLPAWVDDICEALESQTALKSLSLVGNRLGSFGLGMSLEEKGAQLARRRTDVMLDKMDERPFEQVTKALGKLRTLSAVSIASNRLIDADMPAVLRLYSVQKLVLANNYLDDSAASLLGDGLGLFSSLTHLDVSRNLIGDQGMVSILNGVTENGTKTLKLSILKIGFNRVKGPAWETIAEVVESAKNLALLDISGNTIMERPGHLKRVSEAIAKNDTLTVLSVGSMRGDTAVNDPVKSDGSFFDRNAERTIPPLDISSTRIGDRIVSLVGPVLSDNRLVSLDVSNNMITPDGMRDLCKHLHNAHALISLDVSFNDFRDDGTESLAKLLRSGKSKISDLNVSTNRIEDDGMIKLIKTLLKGARDVAMKKLNLSGNYMSGESLDLLIKALNSRTNALEHLDISDMEQKNVWKLCSVFVDRNRSLRSLNIARNNIAFKRNEQAEQFAQRVLKSRSLTKLDVSYNEIGDDGALVCCLPLWLFHLLVLFVFTFC